MPNQRAQITQPHKLSNVTNKVTKTNQPHKGATSMLHKQEGNQQATKAKLVTRATTQAQCMKCKYKLMLHEMQTTEKMMKTMLTR